MGPFPSPTVANIFLICLAECPDNLNLKPQLDDTFLIFNNEQQMKQFFNLINSRHNSIKFMFECEIKETLSFLDVSINNKKGKKFTTYVNRKKTFTGHGMNYLVIITNNITQLHYSL